MCCALSLPKTFLLAANIARAQCLNVTNFPLVVLIQNDMTITTLVTAAELYNEKIEKVL